MFCKEERRRHGLDFIPEGCVTSFSFTPASSMTQELLQATKDLVKQWEDDAYDYEGGGWQSI